MLQLRKMKDQYQLGLGIHVGIPCHIVCLFIPFIAGRLLTGLLAGSLGILAGALLGFLGFLIGVLPVGLLGFLSGLWSMWNHFLVPFGTTVEIWIKPGGGSQEKGQRKCHPMQKDLLGP